MTEISVIIPVYGCKDCLIELHKRLTKTLEPAFQTYEIIFVDDCSKDEAWPLIQKLAERDKHIKAFKMSRNFGQHAAITAGLAKSTGKFAVVMDCDLQDPPEEILNLYKKASEGFDIVYSKRIDKKFSFIRKLFSKLFFKLMGFSNVDGINFDSSFTGFSLISRKVIDQFLKFQEHDRQYIFILRWLGFKSSFIEYNHSERFCGKSSYDFKRLLFSALQGILSQTTILLKFIIFIGFTISFFGFILSIFYSIRYFYYSSPSGWTSMIVAILFMGGIIITTIGIIGLYIARIFEQVKNRPLYVIEKEIKK